MSMGSGLRNSIGLVLTSIFLTASIPQSIARTPHDAMGTANAVHSDITHPLDPMNKLELERAVDLLKSSRHLVKNVPLVSINSLEPSKEEVLSFKEGSKFARKAFAFLDRHYGN